MNGAGYGKVGRVSAASTDGPSVVGLLAAIRAELHGDADPDRAAGMQAYMKSAMPFLGVRVPRVRAIVRAVARDWRPTAADVRDAVLELWRAAEFREERYAAAAVLDVPAARPIREPELIEVHRELIVSGAWWDHVDEVSHRVGELLTAFRPQVEPVVRRWAFSDDHWLRRASIICQLGARSATDLALLTDAILASTGERDFFLRKAIGWALRDYARTDPEWVIAFVDTHELSPLSRREATRRL